MQLLECCSLDSLKSEYKLKGFYKLTNITNNFPIFFAIGTNTMYQVAMVKLCQHVKCINVAFIEQSLLSETLQTTNKNLKRTLDRMKDRNLVMSYSLSTRLQGLARVVVNPALYFVGDYMLRDLYIRRMLHTTFWINDYQRLSEAVIEANRRVQGVNRSSSEAVKESYDKWCKEPTQDNFKAYMDNIAVDKQRFKGGYKPYKQDYKGITTDTNNGKNRVDDILKMNDLDFRLMMLDK